LGFGAVERIKVEGGSDKEKEVIIRHGIIPSKWKTWNYEDFSREWNKTFLTNKREKDLK
jgi:hypothetical protein